MKAHRNAAYPTAARLSRSHKAAGWWAEDLVPTLKRAIADDTVVIIDCPVDYAQNMLLTARLKAMTSPL